jgi:hypothetical protein
VSLYFADATLASAFVAPWCVGFKVETAGGVLQVREDEPAPGLRRGRSGRRERKPAFETGSHYSIREASPRQSEER